MNESRGFSFCFFLSRPSKEFLVRMFGSLSYQSAFFPIFGAGPTSALAPFHCKSEGGVERGYLCTGSASRLLGINLQFNK